MKKSIFSALIVVAAVGGTLASNASARVINAKPASTPGTTCTTNVACHLSATPSCTINNVQYNGRDPFTGLCNRNLALD